MYETIVVPVDLQHQERLGKALHVAGAIARQFDARMVFVAVTANTPSDVAHNPAEFARRLDALAAREAAEHAVRAEGRAYVSHDPAADLDDTLLRAIKEVGADLVVMASHVPGWADRLFSGHGSSVAARTDASVLLVR